MFRLSIFGDLIASLLLICLLIALNSAVKGRVSKTWAMPTAAFVLVSAAVGFGNTLNNIAAVILFRGTRSFYGAPQTTARRARHVVPGVCTIRVFSHQCYFFGGLAL